MENNPSSVPYCGILIMPTGDLDQALVIGMFVLPLSPLQEAVVRKW